MEPPRHDPFLWYWKALSVSEQEHLKELALAEADPWLLERYEAQREHKPHLAKDWLKVIIDRYIEKHGLANTGKRTSGSQALNHETLWGLKEVFALPRDVGSRPLSWCAVALCGRAWSRGRLACGVSPLSRRCRVKHLSSVCEHDRPENHRTEPERLERMRRPRTHVRTTQSGRQGARNAGTPARGERGKTNRSGPHPRIAAISDSSGRQAFRQAGRP